MKKLLIVIVAAAATVYVVYAATTNVRGGRTDQPANGAPASSAAATSDAQAVGRAYAGTGAGMAALREAAGEGKYAFAFFYKDEDQRTAKMRRVFDSAMQKAADRAEPVVVDASDPAEKDIVERFGLDRTPMPLVLAIAPNGAVTRGLPRAFNEDQLMSCFVGPCMEKCLKALQDRKMALVCVQNHKTRSNEEAMRGVRAFVEDKRFSQTAEIVMMDPSNSKDALALKKFGINPDTPDAVTLLLAPPGRILGRFKGATKKADLVAAVTRALSGSGCKTGSGCCGG